MDGKQRAVDLIPVVPFLNRKTRLSVLAGLAFLILISSCKEKPVNGPGLHINWAGHRAIELVIPSSSLSQALDNMEPGKNRLPIIRLAGDSAQILGSYSVFEDSVVFTPLIPFTNGLRYEVFENDHLIGSFWVVPGFVPELPKILAIYPGTDTVPVNLLKVHVFFSKPMREGRAWDHIHWIDQAGDTLQSVFLDIELWNHDRTLLTLWLNPGRIKRDLIPNQEMGAPLRENHSYRLVIDTAWKDTEGMSIKEPGLRTLFVHERDDRRPDPHAWKILAPATGSDSPLMIDMREPLDFVLLLHAIHILDPDGRELPGQFLPDPGERSLGFKPATSWKSGNYRLQVESRIEDLAGNRPDRLFDRDLENTDTARTGSIQVLHFEVK